MPKQFACSNCSYRHRTLRIYTRTTIKVRDEIKYHRWGVGSKRSFVAIGVFCQRCKAFTLTADIEDIISKSIWAEYPFDWPIYYREIAWVDDSIRPVKIRGEGYKFKRFATYYRKTGLFLLNQLGNK